MKIALLHIGACPNWEQTGARLRAALDVTGKPDIDIDYILIGTPEEAARYPFSGSPTILIDGQDPFATGQTITDLACRVFQTGTGLAGTPTNEQLVQALRDHT